MLKEKSKLFKALSDPNRLRILKMLRSRELCVCEITAALRLATSTVSEHLSVLKDRDLIIEKKDGKWVNYSINPRPTDPAVVSILSMIYVWLEDDPTVQNDLNKIASIRREDICSK